jgi:adenylate cyclase
LESLAEPGGICISGSAHEQIENKVPLRYDFMGEHEVKNIVRPVKAYRARMEAEGEAKAEAKAEEEAKAKEGERQKAQGARRKLIALGALSAAVVAVVVVLLWPITRPTPPQPPPAASPPPTTPPSPAVQPSASVEKSAPKKTTSSLPDVPSLAVMPFVNMSEDPKQEFLCDGMTEQIITALSKLRNLIVISRQSTFSYKGKPVNVKQVGEELGVRYILEGSIQRSGERVRVTAQLIDALTGHHLWSDRYEGDVKDIFAFQDRITVEMMYAMQLKLTEGEQAAVYRKEKPPSRLECGFKSWEGWKTRAGFNIEANRAARRLAEEVIAMCPEHASAYVLMGWIELGDLWLGIAKSPQEPMEKAMEMAQKALAIDDSLPNIHRLLSVIYLQKREYDNALAAAERSLTLDPGGSNAHESYADCLSRVGRPEEAIPMYEKAIRLNPVGTPTNTYVGYGGALSATGRFEEAVAAYMEALQRAPENIFAHVALTATYSRMGREEDARAQAAEVVRISPKFSVDSYAKRIGIKDQSKTDAFINALRKAGLK